MHRETPTEITQDAVTAFTTLESHKNYFKRLEALGFDNMCNLQKTVHATAKRDGLTQIQKYFWNEMKHRSFVDSFHLKKHKCSLCDRTHEDGECIFDAKLPKYKHVFDHERQEQYKSKKNIKYTRVNDEVK